MTSIYKKAHTDIDIDVKNAKEVISKLPCIRSTEKITEGGIIPHKSGIHFDAIPIDPISGFSSIEYKSAENLGYQKVDILSQSAYKYVRDRDHLKELANTEPMWELLEIPEILQELSQIKNYYQYLSIWKPKSIDELAMFIAMIRPGKMKCLSMNTWEDVKKVIWDYSDIGFDKDGNKLRYFKKPHAYAYSQMIIVQLNALVQSLNSSSS